MNFEFGNYKRNSMDTNLTVNTLSVIKKIIAFLMQTVSNLLKGLADILTFARWAINFIKFRYLEFFLVPQ